MELALNYSPEAAALLRGGRISIDRFKLPDWPELIAEARPYGPLYVHFPLGAGGPREAEVDWAQVERLRIETQTRFVNLHLRPSGLRFPAMAVDTDAPEDREEVAAALTEDVGRACARFGAEDVVVENSIYRGPAGTFPRPGVEPGVIGAVVERTGCGLLLDLSHARISAIALGLEPLAYIESLPVSQLRELHVAGVRWLDGRLQDHLAMTEEDWALLENALTRIRRGAWRRPETVAMEYGGVGPVFAWRSDPAVLTAQVPRLADALAAAG